MTDMQECRVCDGCGWYERWPGPQEPLSRVHPAHFTDALVEVLSQDVRCWSSKDQRTIVATMSVEGFLMERNDYFDMTFLEIADRIEANL